ncbi:MAG: transporter substrate-binding domain-containing protein [Thermoanaerobaculia bacterium]|nr:transporter substrate-binding domain-containing protein [Thermoanaerobaculia bacterium]
MWISIRQLKPLSFLVGAFLLLAILPASTRASDTSTATRDLDQIVESGQLIMLTFPHQESIFARTNLDQGVPMPRLGGYSDFVGIDVDLVKSFADSLGVELKIRPVSEPRYSALIPDLLNGRGDLIASSLTITEERQELVDFSRPYFEVYPVLVTRAGSDVSTFEQLNDLVGVVTAGSSHEERLNRMGIEPATLLRVDFSIETYATVLEGNADYTLADSLSARRFVDTEPGLEVAFRLEGRDDYGVAVRKSSTKLLSALNGFLEGAHASGEIERFLAKHIDGQGADVLSRGGVTRSSD